MSSIAVRAEHLTKQYVLRRQQIGNYTALRDVLMDKAKSFFTNGLSKPARETLLALDDVSFSIPWGERVGIIGKNGAGKSTLLKILSRIVTPTAGRVTLKGRVASLLEVGTGFHPELTGRENIFLNGAVLGMSRDEIRNKFDDIVAFAEIERFLDTPVKRYSSGMYVRLAFSVVAHLEADILLVDEVLAVGDAAFQKKSLGRMREVGGEGRTVLFVSHNMDAVQRLCNRGILLAKGKQVATGTIDNVVRTYLEASDRSQAEYCVGTPEEAVPGYVQAIRIESDDGIASAEIPSCKPFAVNVRFQINQALEHFIVAAGIVTMMGQPVRTVWSKARPLELGQYKALFSFDDIYLACGMYKLVIGLSEYERSFHYVDDVASFEILDATDGSADARIVNYRSGLILNQCRVEIFPQ